MNEFLIRLRNHLKQSLPRNKEYVPKKTLYPQLEIQHMENIAKFSYKT